MTTIVGNRGQLWTSTLSPLLLSPHLEDFPEISISKICHITNLVILLCGLKFISQRFGGSSCDFVALQFFACCSAAFGKNDVRIADWRVLQGNCSATFWELQRNFRFRSPDLPFIAFLENSKENQQENKDFFCLLNGWTPKILGKEVVGVSRGNTIRGNRTERFWEENLPLRGSLRGSLRGRVSEVFRGF